jgi:hypothetical protein
VHVFGVVVSKLDPLKFAASTGEIPERVNFGIVINDAKSLLAGIPSEQDQPDSEQASSSTNLNESAKNAVVLIYSQLEEHPPTKPTTQDSVPPTLHEATALIQRELEARNAEKDSEAISYYASLTSYYNMGWVHPDAIRLWFFIDRTQNPHHFEKFVKVENLAPRGLKANGKPTWLLTFYERMDQGDSEFGAILLRTVLIRENGELRFEEWQ